MASALIPWSADGTQEPVSDTHNHVLRRLNESDGEVPGRNHKLAEKHLNSFKKGIQPQFGFLIPHTVSLTAMSYVQHMLNWGNNHQRVTEETS